MALNLHREAAQAFSEATDGTRTVARPTLEMLSEGFQISWFREVFPNIWTAVIKPSAQIAESFGLQQEYFVIGNGYPTDFHQRTLKLEPPAVVTDRLDSNIRFVASDAPIAEAFCAAWAQKNKATIVRLRSRNSTDGGKSDKDRLYDLLSTSLWRRDFFAEAEPVKDPTEFFGREVIVNELYAKILVGSPLAIFGLRKIGKSSLLRRLEDVLAQDQSSICATATLIGNSTRITTGRWWNLAQDVVSAWQSELQKLATALESKIYPKAERLKALIAKRETSRYEIATAFERDVTALLKAAAALKDESGRDSLRLVMLLDECDHIYPHLPNAGYWASDFFVFWNSLQSIKRALDNPEQLVYVLSGVNPSGVEQGSLQEQPNPLYETQRIYLPPIDRPGADALLLTLGGRMGLLFDEEALEHTYELVGGHPILLRRLGSAIHSQFLKRAEKQLVSKPVIERTFERQKRDLFNQVIWFLEHLARVAPDEERLLRDIAQGGAQAYGDLWDEHEFRETYAYHLERYGLVKFQNDLPEISLALVREALRKPPASDFSEQKRQLKDVVEAIEQSIRTRLRTDLERDRTPAEASAMVVRAIPGDAKNRALDRSQLTELGDLAGLGAVLDSLNWGDFEILISKYHEQLVWAGPLMQIEERLELIKSVFADAHLVRHNNDHELKAKIASLGYEVVLQRFAKTREMMSA